MNGSRYLFQGQTGIVVREIAGLGDLDICLIDQLADLAGRDSDQFGAHRLKLGAQPVQSSRPIRRRDRGPPFAGGDGGFQCGTERILGS